MNDQPNALPSLQGRVAVVTGASRGAGRGIALELGAAGATVYVTGRSTRAEPADSYGQILALSGLQRVPGSIEDTAEEVARLGGQGVAVRCDHTDEAQVRELFARVEREAGRLDLLVNNAWGGHESFNGVFEAPFWEHPLSNWEAMFDRGVRNHLVASRCAAPLLVRQGHGLIATTTFWDRDRYLRGSLFYDLAKAAMTRLAFGMAQDLRAHGVASVAVSPGWMRTEFVLAGHQTDEAHWHERPALARTESPRYIGRAIVALAGDANVMHKTGRALRVGDLAREYGFTDIDGRQVAPFEMEEGRTAAPESAAPAHSRLEIRCAASRSAGSMLSCITFALVRLAWPLMLSAATMRPARSTIGAATEIRPSSSSWFTRHHCWRRACATLASSASMSVTVCLVSGSIAEASSRARTSSSGRSASSSRPSEVQ